MSDQSEEIKMGSTVWQSQSAEAPRVSLDFVHHHAGKLRRSLQNEWNMFYIVATLTITSGLVILYKHWVANDWAAINIVLDTSMALSGLGLIGVGARSRQNLQMKHMDRSADVVHGLTVYRSELERLIQFAHREWQVLLYFVPGYLTLLIGGLIVDQRPGKLWRYSLTIIAGVACVLLARWVGLKRGTCLQRELDVLDSLK